MRSLEVPLPRIMIQSWGCEALALLSWPGGAGGREGRGYCHEADVPKGGAGAQVVFVGPNVFTFPASSCFYLFSFWRVPKLVSSKEDVIKEFTPKYYLLLKNIL